MKYFSADLFQNLIGFFETLKSSISLEYLLYIFVGLEILTILIFIVIIHNVYEIKLVRAVDRINMYLYDNKTINENNLIEFNNIMKRVPKTLRYHWQQYMLNRDKDPSYYMSIENCIDRPLKSSNFKTNIKIIKALGFIYAGLAFLFACGWASSLAGIGADFYITVFAIPIIVLLLNFLFIISLNIRMSTNSNELYQTFHIFNRFIDRAVTTMPEFVDFEVLFTEKEIKRGIPVLNEYIEKRQRLEEEELKKARENAIQHETYNFVGVENKGELILERAMKEAETFVGMRNRVNSEIEAIEKEIENLKRNFESITKDYQKKLQASKENSERLREQQESTTNRIESNYIKKQQSDEFKKQQQIEKDYEVAQFKFNQEINNLSLLIENKKIEIQEGKAYLEKAMLAEYNTFASKVYKELKIQVDNKIKKEKDDLIASKNQAINDLEQVVSKLDLLEKQNKILVNKAEEKEAYIKAEIGKEKIELEKQLKIKDNIINEKDKKIKLLTENYQLNKAGKKTKNFDTDKYDEYGGYYDEEGNYRYKNGTYYDTKGNFHDEVGNVYDREGNLIYDNKEVIENANKDESLFRTNNQDYEQSISFGEKFDDTNALDINVEEPERETDNNDLKTDENFDSMNELSLNYISETENEPAIVNEMNMINVEPRKKRGRPRKEKVEEENKVPKKRGRPRKEKVEEENKTPKKRGRPRKEKIEEENKVPKKRGRPRKEKTEEDNHVPKKRGRPRKVNIDENLKLIEERLKEQNELLKQQQKALEVTVKNATNPTDKN